MGLRGHGPQQDGLPAAICFMSLALSQTPQAFFQAVSAWGPRHSARSPPVWKESQVQADGTARVSDARPPGPLQQSWSHPASQALGPDRMQPGGGRTDPWLPIFQKRGHLLP